jgi:hypothetical protein
MAVHLYGTAVGFPMKLRDILGFRAHFDGLGSKREPRRDRPQSVVARLSKKGVLRFFEKRHGDRRAG